MNKIIKIVIVFSPLLALMCTIAFPDAISNLSSYITDWLKNLEIQHKILTIILVLTIVFIFIIFKTFCHLTTKVPNHIRINNGKEYKKYIGFLDNFIQNFDFNKNEYYTNNLLGQKTREYDAYWKIENFKCSLIDTNNEDLKSLLEELLDLFDTRSDVTKLFYKIKPKTNFDKNKFKSLIQKISSLLQ